MKKQMQFLSVGLLCSIVGVNTLSALEGEAKPQLTIGYLAKSPGMPHPLKVRDWSEVAKKYYAMLFNLKLEGKNLPLSSVDKEKGEFSMAGYVGHIERNPEAQNALSALIGASLMGIDLRNMNDFNYIDATRNWIDPKLGIFRNRPKQKGSVIHSDIYGYWPVMLSLMLADVCKIPEAKDTWIKTTMERFDQLCVGMGCPNSPDFFNLGFDFEANKIGGRNEPLNCYGNAPAVGWIMYVGWILYKEEKYLKNAEAAITWQLAHPGRYEITHVPGPLLAARLNAELGRNYDLSRAFKVWCGDFENNCPWKVLSGSVQGGFTCDGLDGSWQGSKDNNFYAFTMGTLQGPAWLVPVARYDARYAKMIGKFALHTASTSRLLQGCDLDWAHQDHKDWKDLYDKENILCYEGLGSRARWDDSIRPYATGDSIRLGFFNKKPVKNPEYLEKKTSYFSKDPDNISLYMGNHIGFLGSIMCKTEHEGILVWDCLKTDYYHPKAFPTYLIYNPYVESKRFSFEFTKGKADYYDAVSGKVIMKNAGGKITLELAAESAMVLTVLPAEAKISKENGKLSVDGVIIDYLVGQAK